MKLAWPYTVQGGDTPWLEYTLQGGNTPWLEYTVKGGNTPWLEYTLVGGYAPCEVQGIVREMEVNLRLHRGKTSEWSRALADQ